MKFYLSIAVTFIFILGCDKDNDGPTEPVNAEPGEERVFELTDSVNITMVWIPAGSFMMGAHEDEQDATDDEYPRHRVTFEEGFWIGKYEVTQSQWEEVMGDNPSYFFGDDRPVEQMNWNAIHNFLEQVNEGFRLPSEAEWEYACRAGTDTRFYWGNDPFYEDVRNYAWCGPNSNLRTHAVGQKLPNAWGLYDMSGNVYEWCEDDYHDDYENAPNNGSPWIDNDRAENRVLRGGAWKLCSGEDCRSASRCGAHPSYIIWNICGFRLVLDR